ncbi:hypothetical protein [Arsenicibacter rosenii]|uniref:Uncharacterized protein n=1 Tax=Arsenicibacter rosenii TaxID=1750698 RepID=A0A1S2VB59_9BACT|nr:hypothetical protein [Arsenicibacter rosenii]OIN55909.1 hypothetical protein BLX24_27550 [Arsenicibacter rosenii]
MKGFLPFSVANNPFLLIRRGPVRLPGYLVSAVLLALFFGLTAPVRVVRPDQVTPVRVMTSRTDSICPAQTGGTFPDSDGSAGEGSSLTTRHEGSDPADRYGKDEKQAPEVLVSPVTHQQPPALALHSDPK